MIDDANRIKNNIEEVMSRVEKAAIKSGRKLDDITIVAVTKQIEPKLMEFVLDNGIINFAENKVQELVKKYDIFNERCQWNFIGRLQTNKVKFIIDKISLLHSLDRIDLAREISKRAKASNKTLDVLVQVNISLEETKTGVRKEHLKGFLLELSKLDGVRVRGLMTMAPFYENPEEARWIFKEMLKITIDIKKENYDNIHMDFLSMGMSNDFEIAIEEGSNIVRIGGAIFK